MESITLGGSRATGMNDETSDYDIYVYTSSELKPEIRKEMLEKYCIYMEIDNKFWEREDDCTLNNGVVIEIIYRRVPDIKNLLKSIVDEGNACNGYTTCIWDNLNKCKIIYDKNEKIKELKKEYDIPYPDELRDNIIKRNLRLLDRYMPSYSKQIEKALDRKDFVSVNHRITEFISSYFDIIFALNRQTHPGEKRLIEICIDRCKKLPKDFEVNLEKLLSGNKNKYFNMAVIKEIMLNLNNLIEETK